MWPSARIRMNCGRAVLFTLVAIHFVLPFTPVNQHDERRIIVASMVLGVLFLGLAVASFRRPLASFTLALGVLLFVYVISAVGGSSPIQEGLVIKVLFAVGLVFAILGARATARP